MMSTHGGREKSTTNLFIITTVQMYVRHRGERKTTFLQVRINETRFMEINFIDSTTKGVRRLCFHPSVCLTIYEHDMLKSCGLRLGQNLVDELVR